jgi:hypothetical protein
MGLKTGQAHSFIYGWFKIDFMGSLLRMRSGTCKLYIVPYAIFQNWPKSSSGKVLISVTIRMIIK